MIHPLRDIDRFFFQPQTARVLGLFRIVIGLLTLYSFILWAKDVVVFFSDAGVLTNATLHSVMQRDYHTLLRFTGSPLLVIGLLIALFIVALLFTLGYHTRISSILLYILVMSFHERNNLVLNSGDTILRCLLFFFMFAPAGSAFSVDSLLRKLKLPEEEASIEEKVPPWAQRMMQFQVALLYFVTAYAKSRGDLWHSGHAMYYVMGLVDFNIRGVEQLMNFPIFYSTMTFLTLFAEISLPFLLWSPSMRPYAMLLGIALHGWIMGFMTIPVFGILMLCAYIPFFAEEELDRGITWIRQRFSKHRAKIFFDGDCSLCQRTRRTTKILDLFNSMEFVDVRRTPPAEWPEGKEQKALLEEMHLVTSQGKVLSGFKAFRWISLRLPATFWLAPLLYLPGVPWVGQRVYRWVARNRFILVTCDDSAPCRIHGQS